VTDTIDCGLDVESLERPIDELGIASHSFCPNEVAVLEALSQTERSRRFFELWTLKESYLKAVGAGIRLRLDAVRFQVDSDRSPIGAIDHWISDADSAANEEWQFGLFAPDSIHVLSAAIRRGTPNPYSFSAWELAPGTGAAHPLDLPVVALSNSTLPDLALSDLDDSDGE
jgi:4'-phosphopantetheinyl transferase